VKIDRAILSGLCVVALWASAFPAIKVACAELGVPGLSFARLAVATVALLAVAALRGVRAPARQDLGWIIAAGFFGMTAYQVLLNASEVSVPAGTASMIVAAAPLVSVAVARLLFGERVTPYTVGGSAVALAGVAGVCLSRTGAQLDATAWITVAAMTVQGIYHPLQRPLRQRYTGLEVATYAMAAGTLMSLPLLPLGWEGLVHASWSGWLGAAYLGIFPSAIGFVLWASASGRLPVAVSTSLLYLVPPVAVLIAWAWLGERPIVSELLCGLVVIAGVVVLSQGERAIRRLRRAAPAPAPE